MRKLLPFLSLSGLLIATGATAQDIHFTQYQMQPLLQSPAMAGIGHDLRAVLQHRNQWASVTTPIQDHGLQLRHAAEAETGQGGLLAFGVNFFSDNAGDAKLKSSQGGLSMAYHIKTGQNSTIGAGLFGGFGQRSIDPSGLQWGEQYDGSAYDAPCHRRIARLRPSPSWTWALEALGTTIAGLVRMMWWPTKARRPPSASGTST
jgi:type IX secretion system PorP/SprF family membrane protein